MTNKKPPKPAPPKSRGFVLPQFRGPTDGIKFKIGQANYYGRLRSKPTLPKLKFTEDKDD